MTILSSKSGIISELLIQFEEVRAIPCGRPIGVNLSPSTRATARDRPDYTQACQADAWYSRGDPLRSPLWRGCLSALSPNAQKATAYGGEKSLHMAVVTFNRASKSPYRAVRRP